MDVVIEICVKYRYLGGSKTIPGPLIFLYTACHRNNFLIISTVCCIL
jgi:hypothetical protein